MNEMNENRLFGPNKAPNKSIVRTYRNITVVINIRINY